MKLLKHATALLLAMPLIFGCKKESTSIPTPAPTAAFSFAGDNTYAPAIVSFANLSTNYLLSDWDFGDGNHSSGANPTHTYNIGGSYTVTLTVTSLDGKVSTSNRLITIKTPPTRISVNKILIASLTTMPSGNFDVDIKITNTAGSLLWADGTWINLSAAILPTNLEFSSPFATTFGNNTYYIEVWEKGIFSDTQVGYVPFSPSLYTTGTSAYPSSIDIPSSVTGTGMRIYVSWRP